MLLEIGYKKIQICSDSYKAEEIIDGPKIDLAILDININGNKEGIELAKRCLNQNIAFFYLTCYTDKKTIDQAIETAPGAYILKPFMKSNIYTAIEITLKTIKKSEGNSFSFKSGKEIVKLAYEDILFIKADNIYLEIVTNSKTYLYRSSITKMMEQIDGTQFIRSHRSYLVNVDLISKISTDHLFIQDIVIPLSRTYKSQFSSLFDYMS